VISVIEDVNSRVRMEIDWWTTKEIERESRESRWLNHARKRSS